MMDNPYPICENCIFMDESLYKEPCKECIRAFFAQRIKPNFVSKLKPITNADRIRSMSDEELANMFWSYVDCGECPKHRECKMTGQDCLRLAFEWLREEVKA